MAVGRGAPWPEGAFDAGGLRPLAPVVQERVAVLGEVPAMVEFLFLEQPDIDEEAWAKAVTKDTAGRRRTDRGRRDLRGPGGRWTGAPSTQPPWRWPSAWGANWRRPRPRSGWPSPGGGSALRCSSPSRCSGADRTLGRLRDALDRATGDRT